MPIIMKLQLVLVSFMVKAKLYSVLLLRLAFHTAWLACLMGAFAFWCLEHKGVDNFMVLKGVVWMFLGYMMVTAPIVRQLVDAAVVVGTWLQGAARDLYARLTRPAPRLSWL